MNTIDDPRVDGLLDHGDWEPDDLGYGNPNIFICTEYGCSGCGARNCPVVINELLSGDPWRTKDKRFQQDDVVKIDDGPEFYGHTLVSFTYGGHIYCSICDDPASNR